MWKVSFSLLIFGVVGVAACLTVSQTSWAGGGEGPVADEVLVLHPHLPGKHARAKHAAKKRIGAATSHKMPRRFAALANEVPTQPDIAGPLPVSQMPPSQSSGAHDHSKNTAAANDEVAQQTHKTKAMSAAAAAKHKAQEFAALPREVRQFCVNTANAAADARIAWQAARLSELTARLRQRIAELEVKRAEYEDWLHRHDAAMKEAREDIVAIYSRMRPDAAAAELSVMDEVMAASLLTKLNARVASAILAEMDPGRAARIANAMLGPPVSADGKKS